MSAAGNWLWFDEFEVGSEAELGSYDFTSENIRRFAGQVRSAGLSSQ